MINNAPKSCTDHNKVYDENTMLPSNPPHKPWICSRCGTTGNDIIWPLSMQKPTYAELMNKFGK